MSKDTQLCVKFSSLILRILTIEKYKTKCRTEIEKLYKPINDQVYAKQVAMKKKNEKKEVVTELFKISSL